MQDNIEISLRRKERCINTEHIKLTSHYQPEPFAYFIEIIILRYLNAIFLLASLKPLVQNPHTPQAQLDEVNITVQVPLEGGGPGHCTAR